MHEATRKRLHETIIRLVNGEKVPLGDYELYFDVNRLKSSLYPFMMRRKITLDMPPEAASCISTEANVSSLIEAAGPIPWHEQAVFPVLCHVSNVVNAPTEICHVRLICDYDDSNVVDLDVLKAGKEKMFMDDCGEPWKYATPVPEATIDKWKVFSEYEQNT